MANAFNSVLRGVIFQKLRAIGGDIIQFILFLGAFYAFESPLFYSHHNHEAEIMVIPFAMGTRQCDPLRGALFAQTHFNEFYMFYNLPFPRICLFPSIVDDTHIIGPPL
jgi:hypothetical protein